MKTLEEQMSFYLRYHRNPKNRLTHFFGVPLIVFSLFVPMALPRLQVGDFGISLATVFLLVVVVYYFLLDVPLAIATAAVSAVLLYAAHQVAALGATTAWTVFGVAFVVGWILQLIGHKIEGRRPALVDNFWQVFIAPIFLMAEAFFALGYKREVAAKVEELAAKAEAV
jgi:uncharacterized membrane protein YGL010W